MESAAKKSFLVLRTLRTTTERVLAECVFVGHGIFSVGWWWLMPGGFSIGHVRFWSNEVWPFVLLTISLAGLWSMFRRRPDWTTACVLSLGVMALATTLIALLIFPDIRRVVVLAGALVGVAEVGVAGFTAAPWLPKRLLAGLAAAAALLGCFMPWAQRAEQASTQPLNDACPWAQLASAGAPLERSPQAVDESKRVTVLPASGTVALQLEHLRLEIEPLLTFESTSQSGGWSILSRPGPERSPRFGRLTAVAAQSDSAEQSLRFAGAHDWLSVVDGSPIEVTSFSEITAPIYSHLNSFCILTITGHRELELEFSPCGAKRFEPLPADYPVGRPARFAYCAADRTFRVVEAHSGEKGPFTVLGEGRLESTTCLSIGIVDSGKRIAKVNMHDWAAQLSTAVSPTAGWGVPVNAIEFQRLGGNKYGTVTIWISLAATSVGRGWDTVGHRAGTYRNRITVEAADQQR